MVDRSIRERIEACRPGSDDLHAPELASVADQVRENPEVQRLYEATQQEDERLVAAFQDVPVPEGLEQRILIALDPEPSAVAGSHQGPASLEQAKTATAVASPPVARKVAGSKVLVMASVAALAALVLIAFAIGWLRPSPELGEDRVVELAGDWEQAVMESDQWSSGVDPPSDHPVPREVLASPRRWQALHTTLDRKTVVYDLRTRNGSGGLLFVARPRAPVVGLPLTPPVNPQKETSKRCVAAWQSDGLTYVMVVHGTRRTYQHLVRTTIPLAMRW